MIQYVNTYIFLFLAEEKILPYEIKRLDKFMSL